MGAIVVMRPVARIGVGNVQGIPSLRRALFDIDDREASFEVRGFRRGDPVLQARLEGVGRTFIEGYRAGLASGRDGPSPDLLERAPPDLRGFLAEGAGMGCAVADAMSLSSRRLASWRARAPGYDYLVHVGAGWAMARVPGLAGRMGGRLDPIHHWLAIDGLGFHDTYFHGPRILQGWRRLARGYHGAAYDQGVGRALWFVGCGDPEWAADTIGRLASARRGHLWAGLGLAVAYAGDLAEDPMRRLRHLAGPHRSDLAQGAAFAAAAWADAGHWPAHTERALPAITGHSAHAASTLVRAVRLNLPTGVDGEPPYETWRRGVRRELSEERMVA